MWEVVNEPEGLLDPSSVFGRTGCTQANPPHCSGAESIRELPDPKWCSDYSTAGKEVCESKVVNQRFTPDPKPGYRFCVYDDATAECAGARRAQTLGGMEPDTPLP